MDLVNLLFLFLAVLGVLNIAGIALVVFLFFKTKRVIDFSKKGLQIESGLKEGINEYTEKVVLDWLSKVVLAYKDNLEKGADEHFANFSRLINDQVKTLATHTAAQEDTISKQVATLVAEAKEEIEKYKRGRLANIDQAVSDLVEKVSKDILNRTIVMEEHEELVWKALEEAKNEGIFELDGLKVNKGISNGAVGGIKNG